MIGGYTLSLNILIPAVVLPGLFFRFLALYPWFEAWATGDRGEKHVLDRPRNVPVRTGIGVALITFYVVLVLEGSNDIVANLFHLSINDLTIMFRIADLRAARRRFLITRAHLLWTCSARTASWCSTGTRPGASSATSHGEYIEVHEPFRIRNVAARVLRRHCAA